MSEEDYGRLDERSYGTPARAEVGGIRPVALTEFS
jgi:hypothetical protein